MRLTPMIPFAAALLLSACGSKSDSPQSKEEVASEMKKAAKLKPGKYEMTMTVNKVDVPGMPPEAKAQMEQMMGQPQKMDYCLTAEKSEKGLQDMLSKMNGDCTYSNFEVSGAKIAGAMACTAPTGGTMKSSMTGNATDETTNLQMKVEVTQPGMPATMKMESTMAMKRVGDCAA